MGTVAAIVITTMPTLFMITTRENHKPIFIIIIFAFNELPGMAQFRRNSK
jgi:hypothetical protein